jgi:antitoxin component YwqK of YwqJK toxin-antitoxin module
MSREALATLPSGELTSEEIGILREQHLKNKEIDKAWADSFEANLERLDNVKELEAQIKELEKELAKWEAEEKNRVKASLVDNCKDEKKEKCDFEHLNLCKNEKDCDYIGRYWYGNQCNENPEEDTSEEDTSEEDTSDGEFNCPIPEGAKHMVEYKKDYWVMPNTIKRVGPSQEWYDIEKTKKHRFRCYNIEGERHGVSKWWYEDGTPEYEWNYKDGKFHGVSKGWREDGTPEYERNYKDGKNHGVGKSWREDGTPEYEWNYKDGKKHGVCKRWYEDGTPMDDWNYKDGKRHGVCKRWYEDGTPMDDWNYKDGKNHGVCKRWYEDGSKSECNYKDGKKHGVCKSWDANGKLRSECNYEEDKCVSCDPGHC